MFYSQFILAKKGPLGTIWIAAHLERKLRKNQVADTDIGVSVDSILSPDVPIALRLSSHLLLGVVRIYSRKVNYLFDDCSEALLKVKQAFRSAVVDLPPEESKAPYHSITLPETFELDDFELPDSDIFHGNFVDHHISSRDQITLQDTLDGVTYSTSKFGLDERFGDGDASGLDLDEEIFLEKVDASGLVNERSDPQSSVGPMTPLKQDEHPEIRNVNSGTMVDDDYADLMEYAQAPCTPGLAEEPNLPNVQEVSACDDHMESEYHLGESSMIEGAKNNICGDKQEVNWSSHNNKDFDGVPMSLHKELGDQSGGMYINSSKPQGEFRVEADAGHVPVETLSGSEPIFDSVGLGKPVDTPLELGDKSELASTCHQDESQSRETQASIDLENSSSLNLDAREKLAHTGSPFMRPCNSNMKQPDLISGHAISADAVVQSGVTDLEASGREGTVRTGKPHSRADNLEENLEDHMQEHALQEGIDGTSNKPDSEVMNVLHNVHMDNINNSAEAHLRAPEKLLSVPEETVNQHNNMLPEISPGEFVGFNASDAGSKVVSGTKRSFTESTLTEQSLYSAESSRLVRFKSTIESVPDDDDLLSSILVGKSSVLKVKSTPRPSEVASSKRTRAGAPKRKVLMDDTMVLHGDMIRQQLTNSEDIRRVRKKAPCTQSEISLIQKKNLEAEHFLEPLFTGMSTGLKSLHTQLWNLSGIQIHNNDLNGSSLENVADTRLPSENDKYESPKTTTAPILCPDGVKDDDSLITAAEPHSISHVGNCESLDIENDKGSGRHNVVEQSEVITKDSEMAKPNEIHPNGDVDADVSRQEPLFDASGVETSDKNDYASGPSASVVQMNATTETFETSTFVNADSLAGLFDQEKNALSDELFSTAIDADNRQAISGDLQIARDGDDDFNAVFGTEPLVKDDDIFNEVGRESVNVELLSNSQHGHLEFNGQNEMHSNMLAENIEYSSYTVQQDDFLKNGRSPEQPEAHHQYMMGAENSGFNLHDQEEWMFPAADNDTDFLNVDDDELDEMADDHIPDDEETKFIENTGWSSRTRAVSKYLQTMFVKEAEQGRRSLSLENLLVGKSRKEASRMFFETLVLKTRDYIHVEQQVPFDGIAIKPRTRLMKSVF